MNTPQKIMIITIIGWGFGLITGALVVKLFNDYAESCQIKYVSQDELMALEQDRIKNESVEDKQLFFGQVEQAVKLASSLPKAFEDKTTLVIYSTGPVTGKNVKSISKEVHQRIIQELQLSDTSREMK